MSTHTPGPWIVARIIPQDGDFICQVKAEDDPICFVHDLSDYQQEAKANARLIAAAPDLLEALRPLFVWAEHERRNHSAHGEENEAEYMGTLADAARAAIAKAEGSA